MSLFYDLIFIFCFLLYIPILIIKKKFPRGFFLRLGFLPRKISLINRPIWIHSVSVGELNSVRLLIGKLRKEYPDTQFIISTVTSPANKIARSLIGENDFVTYLPFDLNLIVRKVIKKVNPRIFIIVETEIWPNLINYLAKRNIPIILVNGRISKKSFLGYRKIKFLLSPILKKINFLCVQTKIDAERFIHLGADPSRIKINGNMKFDLVEYIDKNKINSWEYKKRLNLKKEDKLWVCGSTHPGEEKIILSVYKDLKEKVLNLKLLIAPRHPTRAKDIANLVKRFSFNPVLTSHFYLESKNPVYILDTIGELLNFYAISDFVFVGGSLVRKGGHNILEPAIFSKPIILGPYMFNFFDIVNIFLKEEAVFQIHNRDELREKLILLLENPNLALELGRRAFKLVNKHKGATERNLLVIKEFFVFK